MADTETDLALVQHEVQRKLGGCIIRLQQYERLLKAMLATMSLDGPLEQFRTVQGQRVAGMRNRTLGTLVTMFTGEHLTAASSDVEVAPHEKTRSDGQSADVAWASIHSNISMLPERYTQVKEGLGELVSLRNDLVHHLLERFDISDECGCRAASIHLDSCYGKIDRHFQTLTTWYTGLAKARTAMLATLQSKTFEDMFVHGINPDGSVRWQDSSIVECLRDAEKACQVEGWTSLEAAIRFISKANRDQIPSRYGCKTWRQVLKKSEQFQVRSVASSDGAPGHAWYRSFNKATRLGESVE
jgi:hypothetical protein